MQSERPFQGYRPVPHQLTGPGHATATGLAGTRLRRTSNFGPHPQIIERHPRCASAAALAKQLEETRWTEHGEQAEGLIALIEGEHRDACAILLMELEPSPKKAA